MKPESTSPTSLSLLERVRSNDQDAWGQFVHLYGPLVHRWCRKAGLDDADVADVFQESFRSVFVRIAGFAPRRPSGSFRSWLRAIVRTRVIDHFRRRSRQPVAQGGTAIVDFLANTADPLGEDSDDDAAAENALVVQRALELIRPEFSPQNWDAFRSVALDGHSATDVARGLGIEPQAVRQANYRIRRRLRQILRDLTDDADG